MPERSESLRKHLARSKRPRTVFGYFVWGYKSLHFCHHPADNFLHSLFSLPSPHHLFIPAYLKQATARRGPFESDIKMPDEKMFDKIEVDSSREMGVVEYDSSPESIAQPDRRPSNCDSIELQRISTYRLQQQQTVGSCHNRPPKNQWLPMGATKPYPPSLPDPENYVVEFEGAEDPMHPQNWPMRNRYALSPSICMPLLDHTDMHDRIFLAGLLTFSAYVCAYTSAMFPTAAQGVQNEFGFGQEVAALGTTVYVLGFAAGPTVWAPGSELLGRRGPLLVGIFGFSVFTIACATAKDTQTIMLTRFFSGFFAASPIALVPASLSDLFNSVHRGVAVGMYTMAVFIGPFTAPIIGGFTTSNLGWRWTLYIPSFFGFFILTLLVLLGRETYAPTILVKKATILRRQTRNWGIHARQDELEIDFRELITKNLARPVRLLFTEPIVFLLTLYMSFIYGLAYALLQAYPVVFGEVYGMPAGVNGLPFIALIIGLILGTLFVLSLQKSYIEKLKDNNNVPVPEWRLLPCIVGGVAFAGGIFW